MALSVKTDQAHPGGGHAILTGPGLADVTAVSIENSYSGLFLGEDGKWGRKPFAFPVSPAPDEQDAVVLGPHIVNHVPTDLTIALRNQDGADLGKVFWDGILPSRTDVFTKTNGAHPKVLPKTGPFKTDPPKTDPPKTGPSKGGPAIIVPQPEPVTTLPWWRKTGVLALAALLLLVLAGVIAWILLRPQPSQTPVPHPPPHIEPLHLEPPPHVDPPHVDPPHVDPPHVEPPHVEPPHVVPPRVEPRAETPPPDPCQASVAASEGIVTLALKDAARANQAITVTIDGIVYAAHFDAEGALQMRGPLLHQKADVAWPGIGGAACRKQNIVFEGYRGAFFTALIWDDAAVDLGLHVLEPGGRLGGPTHYIDQEHPNTDGAIGFGQLLTFGEPVPGTSRVQLYKIAPDRNPHEGSAYYFVEFRSRGNPARSPFCGGDPRATASFELLHVGLGDSDNPGRRRFGGVSCGMSWPDDQEQSGNYQRWKWKN